MVPVLEEIKLLSEYRIWLRFNDGMAGEIDLKDQIWGEVFEPLKDVSYFRKAELSRELNTVVWPNGADFSPEFLYSTIVQAA